MDPSGPLFIGGIYDSRSDYEVKDVGTGSETVGYKPFKLKFLLPNIFVCYDRVQAWHRVTCLY